MDITKEKCLQDLSAAGENIQKEAERLMSLVQSVQSMPRPDQASRDMPALVTASSFRAELSDMNGSKAEKSETSGDKAMKSGYPGVWTAVVITLIYVSMVYWYAVELWEIRSSVLYAPLEVRLRKFLDHSNGALIVSNLSRDDGCECQGAT